MCCQISEDIMIMAVKRQFCIPSSILCRDELNNKIITKPINARNGMRLAIGYKILTRDCNLCLACFLLLSLFLLH